MVRGFLLDILYGLAIVLTSPAWLARMVRHGRYRRDWGQRLGRAPRRYGLQPLIWVHGVSVGEVNAARALVAELHAQLPDFRVVVSSTTDTGLAAAGRLFARDHVVFRYPLDFSFAVRSALDRLRPALVVLMEGDVWPNLVAECGRRGVPVAVVNGRLGPTKGYPRYRRVGSLARWMFNSLAAIGVQHQTYADMFCRLGVRPDRLHVTGTLKYDSAEVADRVPAHEALAAAMGIAPSHRLLVAGGTGAGEEGLVLEAFGLLRGRQAAVDQASQGGGAPAGDVRLAIIPRKPERFDEVARLIAARGFAVLRRTQCPDERRPASGPARQATANPQSEIRNPKSEIRNAESAPGNPQSAIPNPKSEIRNPKSEMPVLLGDTMGELRKFYALAHAVFVGRSLVPEGGSDMMEAAALGKPVAFGPHTFNFPQARTMVAEGCAVRVADAGELAAVMGRWLADPAAAAEIGRRARQFVRSQQGAARRNVELLCRVLGREPAVAPGSIATDALLAQEPT